MTLHGGQLPFGVPALLIWSSFFAMGALYDGSALSLSAGFLLAGGSALVLSEAAPVQAVR